MRDRLIRPGQVQAGTIGRDGDEVWELPDAVGVAVAGLTEDMNHAVAEKMIHRDAVVLVVDDVGKGPLRVDGDADGAEADVQGPVHVVFTDADEQQPAELTLLTAARDEK